MNKCLLNYFYRFLVNNYYPKRAKTHIFIISISVTTTIIIFMIWVENNCWNCFIEGIFYCVNE